MGGAVAQHMALEAPERVASLVLCASFARLDPLVRRLPCHMREALGEARVLERPNRLPS
jgi:3-oxoadipate enol-lactonase